MLNGTVACVCTTWSIDIQYAILYIHPLNQYTLYTMQMRHQSS